jgi:molecular chaperone DnaK (HSP70)
MLFQIEEPDGSPADEPDGPGAAVGIDLAAPHAMVAVAIGGNAETLEARDGKPGPPTALIRDGSGRVDTAVAAAALLALRGRAERALARPVTHAVIVVGEPLDALGQGAMAEAALTSGLVVTRIMPAAEAAILGNGAAVHGAAIAAEDDAAAALSR